ncbi:hypothetical protein ACH5RR_015637 [Cinchona calisaya]|uniref:Uncharacterized protein n=1 Tax=Cinchona calisaya TaxID=153742 RepID=A0ABD2ZUY3_9GENT
MSPCRIVYGKACHLPMELDHRAYSAIIILNFDLKEACEKKLLDLNELDEFWREALENSLIYKERTKAWNDKLTLRKESKAGDLILLYNSRLKLFLGKLKSWWSDPFEVVQTFPHGAVEIKGKEGTFKVNGHLLKPYLGGIIEEEREYIQFVQDEQPCHSQTSYYKRSQPKFLI